MIKIGQSLGEINLLNQDGQSQSLNSKKQKIIFCYPKANTPGWTIEATEFQLLMERFNKGKVEVYGLSADTENSLKKFSYKCNVSFSLLSDPSYKLLKKLGAWGKKKMYGKEYEGIIRSTYVVDKDNLVSHIFPKASAKGHAAEVAKALNV